MFPLLLLWPGPNYIQGIVWIFQRGVTLWQTEGIHQIFMLTFMPCLLNVTKKKPLREGGSQAPQDSTGYALVYVIRKRVIKSAVLRKFD